MSLSIEQLERCYNLAMGKVLTASGRLGFNPASDESASLSAALFAEIHRRKHGPFTLAEAVASGRPFRRKGAGHWTRKAPAPGDGEPFFEAMTAFDKWEPCPSVSDQHGFTVAEEWLSIDDITACDYELNLDGGD